MQAAKAGQIDLVIMDVGLPDIDGREAVRILRKNGFKAPIIMLTGHDTDSDTILGLESGANDYVTKPFRFAVLLARIRAQLRQHEASEDAVFTIGPYTFRPSSKLLLNPKGNKVRLTEKETAILRYLYRAGQRPVSRETLLQEVWGYNSGVTTHTLETHIYRLRQKIEKDAAAPCHPGHRSRRLQAGAVDPRRIMTHRGRHRVPGAGADAPPARPPARCASSPSAPKATSVQAGQVLFTAGEAADGGYIVQQGSFSAYDRTRQRSRSRRRPGHAARRNGAARGNQTAGDRHAREDSIVLRISRSMFLQMLEGYPDAAQRLRELLASRDRPMGARHRKRPRRAGRRRCRT